VQFAARFSNLFQYANEEERQTAMQIVRRGKNSHSHSYSCFGYGYSGCSYSGCSYSGCSYGGYGYGY
jgi:hypothetical protein